MLGLFKTKNSAVEITVSNRTVIRVVLLVIAAAVVFGAVQKASHAITLIIISIFLTMAFNAPVQWLAQRMPGKWQGNRTLGIAFSFLVVILILGGFVASIAPPLAEQTGNFLEAAPSLIEDVRRDDSTLGKFVRDNNLEDQVDKISSQLSERLGSFTDSFVNAIARITSSFFAVLTVLVLTVMMLTEGHNWLDLGKRLTPTEHRPRVKRLSSDIYQVIKGYVNGQLFLASMAAVFILVPLLILDVGYPIALMVVVFTAGLIPMVGHYIGATIVTLVALFNSPVDAAVIFVYYIIYQQIENYILQPRIQSSSTNLSPLLVFVAVIIGVSFSGLLGGLLAIPVAGSLRVLVLDYLETRKLLSPAEAKEVATVKD